MYGINWEEADVAERKYQVGDRVRVVKGGWEEGGSGHGADIGYVGDITRNYVDFYQLESGWLFHPNEIAPAFHVGDRVKLRRHTATRACGDRGVVDRITDYGVSVRMDEAILGGFFETIPVDALNWDRAYAPDCAERKVEQGNAPLKFAIIDDGCGVVFQDCSSLCDATLEAERLARANPGTEFAVYQRVAGRVAAVSYEMKEVA